MEMIVVGFEGRGSRANWSRMKLPDGSRPDFVELGRKFFFRRTNGKSVGGCLGGKALRDIAIPADQEEE